MLFSRGDRQPIFISGCWKPYSVVSRVSQPRKGFLCLWMSYSSSPREPIKSSELLTSSKGIPFLKILSGTKQDDTEIIKVKQGDQARRSGSPFWAVSSGSQGSHGSHIKHRGGSLCHVLMSWRNPPPGVFYPLLCTFPLVLSPLVFAF